MSSLSAPTIHYRLIPDTSGLKLDIWEPTTQTDHRKASFHFYVSYQLNSPEEAQHILDQYLLDNDVCGAICLEADGGVRVPVMPSSRTQTYAG
ncbi:MAG: hypothetical protein AAFZ80_05235 [Cyanobacteria bacterium P01_A01_bin.105]